MNRSVLITGASRGIGRAIAKRFAYGGDRLILVCRNNLPLLEELAAECKSCWGTESLLFAGNMGNPDEVARLFSMIKEANSHHKSAPTQKSYTTDKSEPAKKSESAPKSDPTVKTDTVDNSDPTGNSDTFSNSDPTGNSDTFSNSNPTGNSDTFSNSNPTSESDPASVLRSDMESPAPAWAPDIVINCAGISWVGLIQDMSIEEWHELTDTNLTAAFSVIKAAIPIMLSKGGGKILNISSVWGCSGASCEAAYSASKGGLNALTMALGKELAPSNIQVNAIACGLIDTSMNSFLSEGDMAALLDEIPAGRMGTPEEVAHLAWQLTDGNAYLTGQVIKLDGGWL